MKHSTRIWHGVAAAIGLIGTAASADVNLISGFELVEPGRQYRGKS